MFYADLHVHSKHSRATSREGDLEHLALWAVKKGLAVVATGDFTHPGWFDEIREKLVAAEPGLYRLRPDLEQQVERWLDRPLQTGVRFMLEVEISTIYKKDGRTRKVHHVIYVPDLASAGRLTDKLSRIGNLASDGRPILGLDSRDLLEITLESGEGCYLVPAHIWTPWFAVLGSKSGFDCVEHCYGDLSAEIFALETGLSSDPAMNWRLSGLDRYRLVSNSDAHSPPKLGREACVFDTELDYFAMRQALETGQRYCGTVEFFPEEGKYHFDGHRKCGVCLSPAQTRQHQGKCPACGSPVTLGVMHRVDQLADRDKPPDVPPAGAPAYRSLIPLDEVLAEVQGVGPQSRAVRRKYEALVSRLGPELFILDSAPLEDIRRIGSSLLAEAISRMRQGRVIREAGFDGQYGTIRLFNEEELLRRTSVALLFDMPDDEDQISASTSSSSALSPPPSEREPAPTQHDEEWKPQTGTIPSPPTLAGILDELDPSQRSAAQMIHGPVLIVAGPGTGKTRTLTHRLAHLIADHGVPPEQCLALTFSRRAAGEMIERLRRLLPAEAGRVPVMTFHALGLVILQEHGVELGLRQPIRVASEAERRRMLEQVLSVSQRKATQLLSQISRGKRGVRAAGRAAESPLSKAARVYHDQLRARGWVDFDDLVTLPVRLLQANPDLAEHYRARYRWVSVDEYQDVDAVQYQLIKLLVPAAGNLCVIGDPDQAIYGFRGADVHYFQRFQEDFPAGRTVHLVRNYRSTRTIVDAALQLIAPSSLVGQRQLEAEAHGPPQIEMHQCATDRAEAEFVVHSVERMIGGSTFFSLDSQRVTTHDGESLSFADFAVLYRTEAQAESLAEAFQRSGMPFQRHSHSPLADQPAVERVVQAMLDRQHDCPADCPVLERLNRAADALGEPDSQRHPALAALRSLAARCGHDLPQFLSEIALGVDVDLWDPRAGRVSLLTLHAAKGLEFPVVFIVGCEDGLIPLHWGSAGEADLAEERRLLFVGMTRAEQRLILTHARKRFWKGKIRTSTPSPFLDDIERTLLAHHQHRHRKKPARVDPQQMLFEC